MLLKFASALFLFTLLPASYAHAGVAPQLGVGTPKRADVKRPSGSQPCGEVNIASAFDKSTAVPASANGEVKVTVLNFNAGADGSRQVRAQVDPSGTGKPQNFVKMTIIGANGDPAPKSNNGSQDVVAQLPTGTKCTGGSTKDKCLVQFVTTSGFGNCVVVSQGGAGNNNPPKARAAGPRIGIVISDRAVDAAADANQKAKDQGGKNGAGKGQKKKGDGKRKQKKGGKKKKQAARAAGPRIGVDISERGADAPAATDEKAKGQGGKNDGGKGQQKKKGDGKLKQKKGGKKKKQAGTRAPRALLVDLDA